MVYTLLGISWVTTRYVKNEIRVWKGIGGRRKHAELIPHYLLGYVEREEQKDF